MKKQKTESAPEAPYSLKRFLLDSLQVIASALVLTFIILIFIQPCMVSGPSMLPTYKAKDFLILWKLGDIERDDIVAFHSNNASNEDYIKRVIAIEGDHLVISDSTVTINGEVINETYLNDASFRGNVDIVISEGCIFVMGDNRNNSFDSRDFGEVKLEDVMGKVIINFNKLFR